MDARVLKIRFDHFVITLSESVTVGDGQMFFGVISFILNTTKLYLYLREENIGLKNSRKPCQVIVSYSAG